MKKEITFEVAPDRQFVLQTRTMEIPDFVEAFVSYAVEQVRLGIREKRIKTVSRALDEFTDYVDDELTYFLQRNDQPTKDEILEWLLESVVENVPAMVCRAKKGNKGRTYSTGNM